MMTTILKVSSNSTGREALLQTLRDAGVGVVEVDDWDAAREQLTRSERAVLVCDPRSLDGDAMRALSHDLRTPLSAMAGWLHLMESGKLDEAGLKRAIAKLRDNIEDQVRTLDRYLGNRNPEGHR